MKKNIAETSWATWQNTRIIDVQFSANATELRFARGLCRRLFRRRSLRSVLSAGRLVSLPESPSVRSAELGFRTGLDYFISDDRSLGVVNLVGSIRTFEAAGDDQSPSRESPLWG